MNLNNKPAYVTVCGLNLIGCLVTSTTLYYRLIDNKRKNRKYRNNYTLVVSELNSIFFNKILNELQLRQNSINYKKVVAQLNRNENYNKCSNEFKFKLIKDEYNIVIEQLKVLFKKNKLLNESDDLYLKQKYFKRLKDINSNKNINIIEDNNYIII